MSDNSGNEGQSPLFDEFLDDYFAESDTHLTNIRSNLLALESLLDRIINKQLTSEIKLELKSLVDELLRSFHTLKGLSGMVGIKEAEALAHQLESYLRALREEQVSLDRPAMEALIAGVKVLEEAIAASGTKTEPPDISVVIRQIAALSGGGRGEEDKAESKKAITPPSRTPQEKSPVNLKPEELERLKVATSKGAQAWHIEFSPERERAERGINVNYVRSRLQEIGELIHAAPRLAPGGKTLFDFVVATTLTEAEFFPHPQQDGISYYQFVVPESEAAGNGAGNEEIPPLPPSRTEAKEAVASPIEPPEDTTLKRPTKISVIPPNVVRVDLARLDDLMRMLGELVISRARLEDQLTRLSNVVPTKHLRPIRETSQTLERQLRDLRQGVMRVRLVPIGQIFSRMQFVVRDVAKATHKQVHLELKGEETEIDKYVVERLIDPLLHIVRNAISHGLESESERLQAGKPAQGHLALRAATSGEMVILEIEDDGRGVDVNRVTERARQMGLLDAEAQVDLMSLLDILCLSGFSTKEQADLTSGRGVGLAVVKNTVQELGGTLSLTTAPGKGTKFTIELPLTLAIADALIVSVGGQTFAVPESSVREVIEVESAKIIRVENWENNPVYAHKDNQALSAVQHRFTELLSFRQDVLPLRRLAHLFGLNQFAQDRFHAVIIGKDLNTVGIIVDRIIGRREIVVQPLSDPLIQVPGLAGATELGDGRVVLILDVAALIRLSKDSEKWK